MATGLLKSHFDEGPLIGQFRQGCPRARRQSLLHLDKSSVGAGFVVFGKFGELEVADPGRSRLLLACEGSRWISVT
jgi:hypothetical protein